MILEVVAGRTARRHPPDHLAGRCEDVYSASRRESPFGRFQHPRYRTAGKGRSEVPAPQSSAARLSSISRIARVTEGKRGQHVGALAVSLLASDGRRLEGLLQSNEARGRREACYTVTGKNSEQQVHQLLLPLYLWQSRIESSS